MTTQRKKKRTIELGFQTERWTVIGPRTIDTDGKAKWLCRCECGTEKLVLERNLLYGGSKSCGCLRREQTTKTNGNDLTGKVFGELTVLHRAEPDPSKSRAPGIWWVCQCSCGQVVEVQGTQLSSGRKKHCSGPAHKKGYSIADVTGQTFGELTAIGPTDERDPKGSVIWHAKCSCGKEIKVSYNNLVHSNMRSCGCRKREHTQAIGSYLTHVAGTSIDGLKSKKIPTDNTTGYKGVYFIRGKYTAKIVFQKKAYYLGTYETAAEAAEARKEAEETLFDGVAAFYERWKALAEADPVWAEANPVEVSVNKDTDGRLRVEYKPAI